MNDAKPPVVARPQEAIFAVWCEDGPDAHQIRLESLDGHLAHIEAHFGRFLVAGPMRRGGADAISGSLFVIAADSEGEARRLMEQDPYVRRGAYARVEYRKLTPAAGRWIGGVIWSSADEIRPLARG
jgi:uncharacterized protein YciI